MLVGCGGVLGCSLAVDLGSLTIRSSDSGVTDAAAEGSAQWCAALAPRPNLLCADFDDGPLEVGWTSAFRSLSELSLDPSASVSPPESLRTRHVPQADAGDGFVGLSYITPTPAAGIRVSFDARVELDVGTLAPLQELMMLGHITTMGTNCALTTKEVQCGAVSSPLALPPALKQWHRWDITLTFGPGAKISIARDGIVSAEVAVSVSFGLTTEIFLGPEHVRSTDDWWVTSDDVVIQKQ